MNKLKTLCTIVFLLIAVIQLSAQTTCEGIDTVFSFKPGIGQNNGQSPEYYPMNIFGMPDSTASESAPSSNPNQILSLGLDGEIIIGFKNMEIFDEPGPDFIIFENAFINQVTGKVFAEPAKVAVSSDGVNFFEFPFDSLSLKGCAGITPTNGKVNPCTSLDCGGDAFDLADLGLTSIRYIKITDICNMILSNPQHPYYDPIISGFDLDAAVGLHLREVPAEVKYESSIDRLQVIFNSNCILINSNGTVSDDIIDYRIMNLDGKVIMKDHSINMIYLNDLNMSDGMYLLIIKAGAESKVIPFIYSDKEVLLKKY